MNRVRTFNETAKRLSPFIEKALARILPQEKAYPSEVHEAMRYAVLDGGKRFRPILVLSACEAVGGGREDALIPACAVELVHCYSLVHDDLPALDNDEMRRGKPTCHRKFGEAIAILAGDALLTRAFSLLSEVRPAPKAVTLIRELSRAAGPTGMIGGQVVDIRASKNSSGGVPDLSTLEYISLHKTGRLIETSALLGARMGTPSQAKLARIRRYGRALGLAFQVVDDTIDGDGYLRVMNFSQAQQKAQRLIEKAKQEARSFGQKGETLVGLADFLLQRIPASPHVAVGLGN